MNNSKKVQYIQGIRAICCLSVAIVHFFGVFYHNGNYFLLSDIGRLLLSPFRGSTSVVMFSILAGYVAISYSEKHNNIWQYLFLRYFRMWIYVLNIAFFWFVISKIYNIFNIIETRIIVEKYTYFYQYILNSIFINDRILGVFWPLLSILVGSTIVSLTNKYSKVTTQKVLILLFISIITVFLGNKIINIVCIGGIYALIEDGKFIKKIRSNIWMRYLVFIIGWLIMSFDDKSTRIGFIVLSIGGIMILSVIPSIKFIKNILSTKFLSHLGNISFEIYCFHFLVIAFILFFCNLFGYYYVNNISNKIFLIFLSVYLISTYISSIIFSKMILLFYKKVEGYILKVTDWVNEIVKKFTKTIDNDDWYFFVGVSIFLVMLFSYVFNSSIGTNGFLGNYSMDYSIHNKTAYTIFDGIHNEANKFMQVVYTYPLYHFVVKILSIFTGLSVHATSGLTICIFVLFTILLVRNFLIDNTNYNNKKIINSLSLASVIIMNLYIPSLVSTFYYPQGSPNLWHNPTFLIARPFAFLTAYEFIKFFKSINISKRNVLLLALYCFLCSFAKPSYAIIFYPVSGIMVFTKFLINKRGNYKHIFKWVIAIIPSILLNLYQFYYMRLLERNGNLFGFKWPIETALSYLIIMTIFPLFVFLYSGYKNFKKPETVFIWLCVFLGWLEYYTTTLADFIWGYEMSAFILIIYSIKHVYIDSDCQRLKIVSSIILITQFIFGLFYFTTGLLGSSLIY